MEFVNCDNIVPPGAGTTVPRLSFSNCIGSFMDWDRYVPSLYMASPLYLQCVVQLVKLHHSATKYVIQQLPKSWKHEEQQKIYTNKWELYNPKWNKFGKKMNNSIKMV